MLSSRQTIIICACTLLNSVQGFLLNGNSVLKTLGADHSIFRHDIKHASTIAWKKRKVVQEPGNDWYDDDENDPLFPVDPSQATFGAPLGGVNLGGSKLFPPSQRGGAQVGISENKMDPYRPDTNVDRALKDQFSDAIVQEEIKYEEDPVLNLGKMEFGDYDDEDSEDSEYEDDDYLRSTESGIFEPVNRYKSGYYEDDDLSGPILGATMQQEKEDKPKGFHPDIDMDNLDLGLTSYSLEEAKRQNFTVDPTPTSLFSRSLISVASIPVGRLVKGTLRNWGYDVKFNIGDHEHTPDDAQRSIAELALFKAKQGYEFAGVPVIAEATSFEVESVEGGIGSRRNARYRFNRIGPHLEKLVEILKPISDPNRMTFYRSVMCYYDGENTVFELGELDCAIFYANTERMMISASAAMNKLVETLANKLNLTYIPEGMLTRKEEGDDSDMVGGAARLQETLLRYGRVLPGQIVDVSSFMDSSVDVALMEDCARELVARAERMQIRPSKILSVATTGLIIALPMATILQVPVVYARKERSIVMSDTYNAVYRSRTKPGEQRELFVAKDHIDPEDRILIVDDFMSSGTTQEALLKIILEAGATPVGVCVLVEKGFKGGRNYLAGFDIPIESLANIKSVDDGCIRLSNEAGI